MAAGSTVGVTVGDGGIGVGSGVGVAAAAARVLRTAAERPDASPVSDCSTQAAETKTKTTNTHALAARVITEVYQTVALVMIAKRLNVGALEVENADLVSAG